MYYLKSLFVIPGAFKTKIIPCIIFANIILGAGHMIERSQTYKYADKGGVDLDYLLYLPSDFNEIGISLPLVLFLHGAGERGSDLNNVKIHGIPKQIDKGVSFPFICIAPQCPEDGYWDRPEYVSTLLSLVNDVREDHHVESNRIYGTGLSMGGLGVLAMSIQDPKFFSAIIPVCGGANLDRIDRLRELPIWLFHGDRDEVHPVENSISIYQHLRAVNDNIYLTIYGNVGHDSWTVTYENNEIYDWLMQFDK